MNLEILTQISLVLGLAGYIWNDAKVRNEKTALKVDNLEKRVQKIEDIQGNKLDSLSGEFKEFKKDISQKIDGLTEMIHKDKNMEGQLNQTLSLLLKELQREKTN
jgi:exosome complex RNA-binding protein Rrp4